MNNPYKIKYFIILTALSSFCALFFSLAIVFNQLLKLDKAAIAMDHGYVFYRLQHESNPFNIEISDFDILRHEIIEKSNGAYTYYEIYTQHLEKNSSAAIDEKPYYATENGQINCIQIGENVQHDFNFSLSKGKLFNHDDFLFDGTNSIPVLMGYDYLGIFEIGDTFSCNYLYDAYDFCVVGFLEPETQINISYTDILLDSYIVMPSFEVENNMATTSGLKIHYANKTSGFIKVSLADSLAVHDKIMLLIDNNSAGEYSINSTLFTLDMQNKYKVSLETLLYLAAIVAALLLSIALFLTVRYKFSIKYIELIAFSVASFILHILLALLTQFYLGVRIDLLRSISIVVLLCVILSFLIKCKSNSNSAPPTSDTPK